MRRFRIALLSAPVLLLPLFVACEDGGNTSSSGGFQVPEGGGFEAGPAAEGGPLADVFVPDSPIDTFVPPKGAKITVRKGATGEKDVRVLAHDATGAVIADVKTDATGVASFAAAPSMITVLAAAFSDPSALTYLGVADGDALVVTLPDFGSEELPFATYTASVTAFAGATFYNFNVGGQCGNSTNDPPQPTNISLYNNCLGAQNAVLATAFGNGGIVAFGFQKNQAKPAAGATVVVPNITLAVPGKLTMDGNNLPANTFSDAELRSIANGVGYYTDDHVGTLDDGGYTFSIATGFAEAYQSLVAATKSAQGPTVTKGFLRRENSNNTAAQTITYDFATALPYITNGVASGAVPARSDVALTADASLAATDGGIVRLQWNVVGGLVSTPQWSFVVPPGTTTFKVPALPNDAEAAKYLPLAGVTVRDAIFVESSLLPGYAQLKALPISLDGEPPAGTDVGTPLPLNGTVKVTAYNRDLVSRGR